MLTAIHRLGHADPAVTLRVYSHVLREHAQEFIDLEVAEKER